MRNFYWLIPDVLAGVSCPGVVLLPSGKPGIDANELEDDLAFLQAQGISALLSLTEEPLDPTALAAASFTTLHLPVPDMTPPTPGQFRLALAFLDHQRAHNRASAVHCLAGQGRTGSMLAAYLIRGGLDPAAALAMVRAVCPGAVENALQEAALREFALRRDWIV